MHDDEKRGFKEHSADLDAFLASKDDGVFYVGHASILVRLGGKKFLFDPVRQGSSYWGSWHFYPEQVMDPRLLDVDGVIVSHWHEDHFDKVLLKQLPPSTKIYIVGGRPIFLQMFKDIGLNPIEIPPGQLTSLEGGIEVIGMLHEYNIIDSSMIMKNANLSVYHGNDNYVTSKTLLPIRKLAGPVDIGCIPFSYVHWYPFLLDGVDDAWREQEAERLISKCFDLGIEQAEALDAGLVIPFGANLLYYDDAYSVMNKACRTPIEFEAYAKAKLGAKKGERYKALFAGDYVLKPEGKPLDIHCRGMSQTTLLEGLQTYLQAQKRGIGTGEDDVEAGLADDLSWIEKKLAQHDVGRFDHILRVENLGKTPVKIEIDLHTRNARKVRQWQEQRPYHYFRIEPMALRAWLKQEMNFDGVMGTRRFRIERVPNDYNLDILSVVNNVL